ncbi:hypothetical protein OROGR_021473 [Orobanche gracilis]
MELKSPLHCPPTVTIRRNPPRKARPTPLSAVPLREPLSSPSLSRDLFAGEGSNNAEISNAENLKVFLRIRPLTVQKNSKNPAEHKNAWPKKPKTQSNNCRSKTKTSRESCLQVNEDSRSVTVATPQAKSEVYGGFSHVFGSEALQSDVYEEMVKPLVDDFLKGKSGMLAAMGPSGSGKTHTVFGCAREPGMVPLAIRRIFSENKSGMDLSRVFYLSMFEISSEKGKAERMVDLLHDQSDICMQQSVLKGLQEAVVCDAQQAESLIAHGMLKRATATTNSNSQSSRSQCIINIRCDSGKDGEESDGKASSSMLTIVDLAGAEREKKTGNQGARLHESNFINNTSMVFGLCLRSLLEHQKNKNKPLQKHYKNSMLTRYLRDYLEGKKRMMLMLTVKPGVEDYLDTSFLLRQASPFTKIKYKTLEEPVNFTSHKRPYQALPPVEQLKKMKLRETEVSLIDEGNTDRGSRPLPKVPDILITAWKEIAGKLAKDCLKLNIEYICDKNLNTLRVSSDGFFGLAIGEKSSLRGDYSKMNAEKNREYQIMQGLSKALLSVLKQYKIKLQDIETENCHISDSLINEKKRSLDLENKLASEKERLFDLENELIELRSRCTCTSDSTVEVPVSLHDASYNLSQYQRAELYEANVPYYSLKQLEKSENEEKTDPSAGDSIVTSASYSGGIELYSQQFEDFEGNDYAEEAKCIKDTYPVDMCVLSPEYSRSTKNDVGLVSYEDKGIENVPFRTEASSESSGSLYADHESGRDAVNFAGDVKNLEVEESACVSSGLCHATSLELEHPKSSQDYEEDLEDTKQEPTQLEAGAADDGLSLVKDQIAVLANSLTIINIPESPHKDDICFHEDGEQLNSEIPKEDPPVAVPPKEGWDVENTHDSCSNSQHRKNPKSLFRRLLPASSVLLKDISILDIRDENNKPRVKFDVPSRSEASSESSAGLHAGHESEQDAVDDKGDVKNLEEEESVCVSSGSCHAASLECENPKRPQDCEEDLEDTKEWPTQLEDGVADDGESSVKDQIVAVVDNSITIINISKSPQKDDICFHGDEEPLTNETPKVLKCHLA